MKRLVLVFALLGCHARDPSAPIEPPSRPGEVNLGAACRPGPPPRANEWHSPDEIEPCGSRRRVAIEQDVQTAEFRRPVTCKLGSPRRTSAYEVTWCIDDGRLYAKARCFACRVPFAGWSVVALLDELPPRSSVRLQEQLGLPFERPLRGAAAWESALAR